MDKPEHILIIDDEADLVDLVSYNLKKEGFIVDSALDGETALSKIRKGQYDLLILDLMLPGIQGIELCRIVRNDPRLGDEVRKHRRHGYDSPPSLSYRLIPLFTLTKENFLFVELACGFNQNLTSP